ncbi:MAG: hypothetical protein BWY06_03242 [Candidatus Latescibacteria bacterium ADurb.Bin168]|nr:MAG: hypothetical protein BWY06_03242 [Candidatus Latescibacteria bacterium ADurb.Bin168]
MVEKVREAIQSVSGWDILTRLIPYGIMMLTSYIGAYIGVLRAIDEIRSDVRVAMVRLDNVEAVQREHEAKLMHGMNIRIENSTDIKNLRRDVERLQNRLERGQ